VNEHIETEKYTLAQRRVWYKHGSWTNMLWRCGLDSHASGI